MEAFNSKGNIIRQLDRTYREAEERLIAPDHRYIFFSDHHRGNRGASDFFKPCEKTYNAALGYYLERGHTLVQVGDVEEFWECRPSTVVESYPLTYELEREFYLRGRFVKMRGNHDNLWRNPRRVERYLGAYFPEIKIIDSLRLLRRDDQGKTLAEVFVTHGHQGTFLSDTVDWFGMFWLRFMTQSSVAFFKQRYRTPANSYSLRERLEKIMFDWVDLLNSGSDHPILFVAGHTHHPIFMNRSVYERMFHNIEILKKTGTKKNLKRAATLRAVLEYNRADVGQNRELMQRQSYLFNTGCCSFRDGSITGIELTRNKIRLIKWRDLSNRAERIVLGSARLEDMTHKGERANS